jgi:MFS family permease
MVIIAAALWGVGIVGVGLSDMLWLTLFCLAFAGAADMVSGIFRMVIWSQTIPDHLRGRLAGIEMLSYSLGPLGGQVRAGVVADLWSVRGSIVSGGLACAVGVLATATWLRDFWRYDARTDEHAVAERVRRGATA